MTQFPTALLRERRTPFYFYDLNLLGETLDTVLREIACKDASEPEYMVNYAIKANANPDLLRIIASKGFGADLVSGGEIEVALAAGFEPCKMTFAGVGKADWEIEMALDCGIGCINVESAAELDVIEEIARRKGVRATVALRVNPNIDAHTHHYITTGLAEDKFGIAMEHIDHVVRRVLQSRQFDLAGLHFHIGSQITINEPFKILCDRIMALLQHFEEQGIRFRHINVGGGLGVDYDYPDTNPIADFHSYFATFRNHLPLRGEQTLHFELGRCMVAQCGSLITRVLYVKQGLDKQFCIVDAGMTELIRPALYQAHHHIQSLTGNGTTERYDVVGPVCESSDVFGTDEALPHIERGDLLAIRSAGAYGEAMSSHYNCRTLQPALCYESARRCDK